MPPPKVNGRPRVQHDRCTRAASFLSSLEREVQHIPFDREALQGLLDRLLQVGFKVRTVTDPIGNEHALIEMDDEDAREAS